MGHLPEAHAAQAEVAVERARTAADLTAVAMPRGELRRLGHLGAPCCGGHNLVSPRVRGLFRRLERHPELLEEVEAEIVLAAADHERDVHAALLGGELGFDLGENQL